MDMPGLMELLHWSSWLMAFVRRNGTKGKGGNIYQGGLHRSGKYMIVF